MSNPFLKSRLEHLSKDLKYRQLQGLLDPPKPLDWECDHRIKLLHLAVIRNDLTLIKYLLDINYVNVNAKNSSSESALLIAVKLNNFEAIKILLHADADIFIRDRSTGKTALELLMMERQRHHSSTLKQVIGLAGHITENLKRSKINAKMLAELFTEAGYPFSYILDMNNEQINEEFIKRNPLGDYHLGMLISVKRRYLKTVELILRSGNESGISFFNNILCDYLIIDSTSKLELWKVYIERLIDWNAINKGTLESLDVAFCRANLEALKILLDCKIDVYVRENFGLDLRTSIFGSWRVDAVEFLRNQNFNINTLGFKGNTALHFAVKNDRSENVQLLLNSGADVHIKNESGRTALFGCMDLDNTDIGKLLLEYGADVQVADNNGISVFEIAENKKSPFVELLLAQLAISHLKGVTIDKSIQDRIDTNENYRKFYTECCEELHVLKSYEFTKSSTFFTVLTEPIERLHFSLNYQKNIAILKKYKKKHGLNPLYDSTLMSKLCKTWDWYRFKRDIAKVISKRVGKLINFDHLVVRRISKYLTQNDIDNFVKNISLKRKKY